MLEAILLNLLVAKTELNTFIVRMEASALVEIHSYSVHKATVRGKNGAEHTDINDCISILQAALSVEKIQRLDNKLW